MASSESKPSPVIHNGGALPEDPTPMTREPAPASTHDVPSAVMPTPEVEAPDEPAAADLPPELTVPPTELVVPPTEHPTPQRRASAPRSRIGGVWVASILFAAVLLLLLIFVLENNQRTEVSFLGAHGHLPEGVALLLAAVCGILLVAIPGTARVVQLRIRDRRHRSAAAAATENDSP